ncbi:transposase [Deltaproteobacteria bacterium TL4]
MELLERSLSKMSNVSKPQRKFLITLFSTIMMLRGRMNFRNMSRYSELSEISYLRNFRKPFNFTMMNALLLEETIPNQHLKIGAIDCSYIPKSGKQSYGIDKFWSGQASCAKNGQEISLLSVIDIPYGTAYSLSVEQTPSASDIGKGNDNRIDFYLKQIEQNKETLKRLGIQHISADGFYTKTRFINGVLDSGFHLVGKLREDANLRYLYEGPQTGGKGAPKRYDGKVQFEDLSRWTFVVDLEDKVSLYTAELNAPCFKRNLRVVYLLDNRNPKKQRYALFFSTDTALRAVDIFFWYKARYQIEFIFRDAKQFTGLTDCQARNKEALNFHFNASLSALNLLKKLDRDTSKTSHSKVCSIASWKARYFNEHLLERFIQYLELKPLLIKNHPRFEELRKYGSIAA